MTDKRIAELRTKCALAIAEAADREIESSPDADLWANTLLLALDALVASRSEVKTLREELRFSVPEKATAACVSCARNFKMDARQFHKALLAGEDVLCKECR